MNRTVPAISDMSRAGSAGKRPRIAYLVTEDWYFVSHRLPLAVAAKAAGFDVSIFTRVTKHAELIADSGLTLCPIEFNRSGLNPVEETRTLAAIVAAYRRIRPDIVHHVALKPVLYGSLAARVSGAKGVVNALGGLGHVFSGDGRKARLLRPVATAGLRLAMSARNSRLIVQNADDRRRLLEAGIADDTVRLIRGAGVDPALYGPADPLLQPPLVLLPARLLREKGVVEFVDAARMLKARGVEARFVLVGAPDPKNPASIPAETVDGWVREGVVECWGWREDMPQVIGQAQIVCLPSYHEGLPKSLLEAAAAGCAIAASDIPGCRELIGHEVNGLLFRPRDTQATADALERLIRNPALRQTLGSVARATIVENFSMERVIRETLSVYDELLAAAGR